MTSAQQVKRLTGGVICALVTPFDVDEKPDPGALNALLDYQISAGINGLFVAGTSGEGPLMIREERRLLAEAVVDKVAGRTPVIIHCGAADTRTSEHLARHAEAVGADAVAVVGPYFYRSGPEGLYEHYRSIAEAAPSIPHYLYENPERVGYSLGVELVGRLTSEVRNIVGVKDTGDSIGRLMMYFSLFDPPPDVYTGNNALVFAAMSIGAKGAVSALANVAPRLFVEIFEATRGGRTEEALELQKTASRFQGCFSGLPYVPAIKHLLSRSGFHIGRSRRPHMALSAKQAHALETRVDSCKGLSEWLAAVGD
jgi:4-hydroxy-tetrahydrodipicolinate synthase